MQPEPTTYTTPALGWAAGGNGVNSWDFSGRREVGSLRTESLDFKVTVITATLKDQKNLLET